MRTPASCLVNGVTRLFLGQSRTTAGRTSGATALFAELLQGLGTCVRRVLQKGHLVAAHDVCGVLARPLPGPVSAGADKVAVPFLIRDFYDVDLKLHLKFLVDNSAANHEPSILESVPALRIGHALLVLLVELVVRITLVCRRLNHVELRVVQLDGTTSLSHKLVCGTKRIRLDRRKVCVVLNCLC